MQPTTSGYNLSQLGNTIQNYMQEFVQVLDDSKDEEYRKYVNQISWDQFVYQVTSIAGGGMAQVINDGETPLAYTFSQTYTKSVTPIIFVNKYRVTAMTQYFSKIGGMTSGAMEKIPSEIRMRLTDLKKSITDCKNYLAQGLLSQGFTSSFTFTPVQNISNLVTGSGTQISSTAWDGLSIWNVAHPYELKSGTFSNIITSNGTVNAPFSLQALLSARTQYSLLKDANGLPIQSELDRLVVRTKSPVYYAAMTIKRTLDSGYYPSTNASGASTAGISGSYVDRAPTNSFEIIELKPYGNLTPTNTMWFLADSSKMFGEANVGRGFMYIQTRPFFVTPQFQDLAGNYDIIVSGLEYGNISAFDMRYWLASTGLSV